MKKYFFTSILFLFWLNFGFNQASAITFYKNCNFPNDRSCVQESFGSDPKVTQSSGWHNVLYKSRIDAFKHYNYSFNSDHLCKNIPESEYRIFDTNQTNEIREYWNNILKQNNAENCFDFKSERFFSSTEFTDELTDECKPDNPKEPPKCDNKKPKIKIKAYFVAKQKRIYSPYWTDIVTNILWRTDKVKNPDLLKLLYGCGFSDQAPSSNKLEISASHRHYFKYDRDIPYVSPSFGNSSDLQDILSSTTFIKDENIKSVADKYRNNNEYSIKTSSWDNYNWFWTNDVLSNWYRCEDEHSGCKNKNTYQIKDIPHRWISDIRISFEDNVNNRVDIPRYNIEVKKFTWINRVCRTENHSEVNNPNSMKYLECRYVLKTSYLENEWEKIKITDGNNIQNIKPWKRPLIDRTSPTINITLSGTSDNPLASFDSKAKILEAGKNKTSKNSQIQYSNNPKWNLWSFYAGKVKLPIKISDPKNNNDWVSGIRKYAVRIVEKTVNWDKNIVEFASWIPYDSRRTENSYMDNIKWEIFVNRGNSEYLFIKKWNYSIIIVAEDYAGNVTKMTQDFKIVENFSENSKFEKISKSDVSICENREVNKWKINNPLCNQSEVQAKNVGGFYVFENNYNPANELFADWWNDSFFDFKITFYDKYFNKLDSRNIKKLDYWYIAINQVRKISNPNNKKDNAFVVALKKWNNYEEFYNWDKTNEKFWKWRKYWLNESKNPNNFSLNNNWEIFMIAYSYAPGIVDSSTITGEFCYWSELGVNNCNSANKNIFISDDLQDKIIFNHIFTGSIVVNSSNDSEFDNVYLGAKNKIAIKYFALKNPQYSSIWNSNIIKNLKTYNFLETVLAVKTDKISSQIIKDDNRVITKTGSYNSEVNNFLDNSPFNNNSDFIIEQSAKLKFFNSVEWFKIQSFPYVEVEISGRNNSPSRIATYYLSPEYNKFWKWILYQEWKLNRIYIEWIYQSVDDQKLYVTETINTINEKISLQRFRNSIHKNVALLTRNIAPNSPDSTNFEISNNWILYISGNYTDNVVYSKIKNLNYNTLIIQNSNLIIDENIEWNKAIVLISNKINTNSSIPSLSSVVKITPNVQKIEAYIYADWSVFSVKDDYSIFNESNFDRSRKLQKQLVIIGWLVSKNTIWWAVYGDSNGEYKIPIWTPNTTSDLDLAVNYDLSFLRMNNKDSLPECTNKCEDYAVAIIHNNEFIINPPLIFDFKE